MAANIAISEVTPHTNPIDLSALTSPGGVWTERQGFVGSDFHYVRSGFDHKSKAMGGEQLFPELYTEGPGGVPGYGGGVDFNRIIVAPMDVLDNGTISENHNYTGENPLGVVGIQASGGAGWGHRWPKIIADRRPRSVFFLGEAFGSFSLHASLTDGSFPDRVYTVGAFGQRWFRVDFEAHSACNLVVKLLCNETVSGQGYMRYDVFYITPPGKAMVSRFLSSRGSRL